MSTERVAPAPLTPPAPAWLRPARAFWRYWFRPGGEISLGIVRIALFAALLKVLFMNYGSADAIGVHLQSAMPANYIPKGILKLLGALPFSVSFMTAVWWVALASCLMAIIGLLTRPAMIAATLSTLALVSFRESFGPYWSHGYNVNFIATLAFMFGPAGASLSVDRLLNRASDRWPPGRDRDATAYYWPVLAAQVAVAFFYFGAFWSKLYNGGLYWALGDNMRIMVGITWDHPYMLWSKPYFIDLLLENKWLWQFAAVFHLVTQFLPMTAAFFVHRPAIRLFEGFIFVAGVYGLLHVMTVWNPQWLWLGAVFVDWEWLAAGARSALRRFAPGLGGTIGAWAARLGPTLLPASFAFDRHGGNPPPALTEPGPSPGRLAALGYVLALFGYATWVCGFQLAHKHLNYPFSSFDFYATVYSLPPYDQHRHFTFMVGGIRIVTPSCADVVTDAKSPVRAFQGPHPTFICRDGRTEFNRQERQQNTIFEYYRSDTAPQIEGALSSIRGYVDVQYPAAVPGNARIELLTRLWQYPPYPEPMRPRVTLEALRGVRLPDGRVLSAVGTSTARTNDDQTVTVIEIAGFARPVITIYGLRDAWYSHGPPARVALPGNWSSPTTFEADLRTTGRPQFTTIGIREEGSAEEFEFWGPVLY